MAESSRRYNLRNTKKKPQGELLKRWEVEYSKLINSENRRIPLEKAKTAICGAFEDGIFEQWRITLKCPLSGQRIKVPARYADCTHIECFDLEAFLRMKTQKNLRVCPICQKEVEKPLANLRIDKYIETVLSTLPTAMQVELQLDGSFTEVDKEFVVVENVINDEEPFVQDNNAAVLEIKQEVLEDDDEYITLTDGEEDSMEEIVEMKPISFMPLYMDIKPMIASFSEPEQTHSEKDQESQTEQNPPAIEQSDSLATSNGDSQNQPDGFGKNTDESATNKSSEQNETQFAVGSIASSDITSPAILVPIASEVPSLEHPKVPSNQTESSASNPTIVSHKPLQNEDSLNRKRIHNCDSDFETGHELAVYKCQFCDFAAARHSSLVVHGRIHSDDKPYKCQFCEFSSAQNGNLTAHIRIHTGEKPYKCRFCDYAAARSVTEHERSHSDDKPYKCRFCEFESAYGQSLNLHIRSKHKDALELSKKNAKR
ncbi:c2H2-type zinc-finger domain-containing protein [Ditylenchus destructor]|nr:c2H2-type zinc-finger domain-containing protein [Ditylenchus destructor]